MEREGNSTIIAWSRAKSVLNMKPHDFCTLSHTMQVDNHTTMVGISVSIYVWYSTCLPVS